MSSLDYDFKELLIYEMIAKEKLDYLLLRARESLENEPLLSPHRCWFFCFVGVLFVCLFLDFFFLMTEMPVL